MDNTKEYRNFKKLRPLFGSHEHDEFDIPILNPTKLAEDDFANIKALNIQNLSCKRNNSNKLILPFREDDDLGRYWNDPLKYIPAFQTAKALCTLDFSILPKMNYNDIRYNTYKNRWHGCLCQDYGCDVIATISWALKDTYDICFSGVRIGEPVVVSTMSCADHMSDFLAGYDEMMKRIQPRYVVVFGTLYPGIYGKIINYKYTDGFGKTDTGEEQLSLLEMSPFVEIRRDA